MVAITKTLCAIAAVSSVAIASPTPTGGKGNSPKCTAKQAQEYCAKQEKTVSCLNKGGVFNLLNIPVLDFLLQVTALCSTKTVACCDTDQDAAGLIVIQNSCSPIQIL